MVSKNKLILLFLIVLPIVLWLYNPAQLYFLNDDAVHIPQSADFSIWSHFSFRMISDITLFGDYKLYEKAAWGYHLTNLVLHCCCTCLLYLVVRKLGSVFQFKGEQVLAVLSALFFFVYAFHSEAVFWIIGRGGSLGALFFSASFLYFIDCQKRRWWYYLLSLLFFLLGLFSYESIWILPLVLSILAVSVAKNKDVEFPKKYLAGHWTLLVIFLLVRKIVGGSFLGSPYQLTDNISSFRWKRIAYNFTALTLRSFLPPSSTRVFVILSALFICAVGLLLFNFYKRHLFTSFRCFLYLSFLCSLLPYVMFGIDTHDSESGRFLYLPALFFCIIIADLILLVRSSKWQMAIILGFCFYQLFFLYQFSKSFKYSSLIAEATISILRQTHDSVDTLYLINVPTQYKGAFIFRIGFEPILQWLAPSITYNHLREVRKIEIFKKADNFSAEIRLPQSLEAKEWGRKYSEISSVVGTNTNGILIWTDSTFNFIP